MSPGVVSRRHALMAVGAAGLASVAGGPQSAAQAAAAPARAGDRAGAKPRELDLSTPEAQLRAYLKLFVSLAPATIFYTYHGTLNAAVPGRGLVALLRTTSLVRRLVEPLAEGWRGTIWEATAYHRAGEDEPADSFENPLNGRVVQPFHQREGGNQSLFTTAGQFYLKDGQRVAPRGASPTSSREWQRAGDRVWTSRESMGVYAQSPFDPDKWPLEFSGRDLQYLEKTTNSGLASELADSGVSTASSTYSLNQVMLWWPWLLMAQAAGFLVWNTQGVKLPSLDALEPGPRRLIQRAHPELLGDPAPWTGYASLWTEYPKLRQPAKP